MTKKEVHRLLAKFLKKNGILNDFIINSWESRRHYYENENISHMEVFSDVTNIISAFPWSLTRQGQDFWARLNVEFISFLESYEKI